MLNLVRRLRSVVLPCLVFAALPSVSLASGLRAFTGARILPVVGPEIEDGVLLVENGKIRAVGALGRVRVPREAQVEDVSGKVIIPGLVCTHQHVGQPQGGDRSGPLHPDARVLDAINVRHSGIQRAQAGGVTTANIMSGSGHLMSGQTVYLKFKDGRTVDDLVIRREDGQVAGGMKMANGTNSQRDPPFPGTRAKSAALVRELFVKAVEYHEAIERADGDPEKLPERDLGLEALGEVLDGTRIVHHHTHRHDDILTVLRLSEEFGFRVVLHHVSEAWKVADEIAAADAPCSIIMIDSPGGKLEARDIKWDNAPVLEKAGVDVAFHTDDYITDSRLFLRSAAFAVRAGMSRDKALEGLTLAGARMMDLQDRVGSLEPGKDADFVLLDGDPLSTYTRVLQTWIEGDLVFDREDPQDALWATGGWGAGNDRLGHACCHAPNDGEATR